MQKLVLMTVIFVDHTLSPWTKAGQLPSDSFLIMNQKSSFRTNTRIVYRSSRQFVSSSTGAPRVNKLRGKIALDYIVIHQLLDRETLNATTPCNALFSSDTQGYYSPESLPHSQILSLHPHQRPYSLLHPDFPLSQSSSS